MKKLTYEYIKDFIENKGWILISEEYINSKTKLDVQCIKGHQYPVTFHNFQQGNKCPICSKERRAEKQKYIYEYVKNFIENKGTILHSKEYIGCMSKLDVECIKGHHRYSVTFSNFKNNKSRCPICYNERRNENSKHNYEYVKKYIKKEGYKLLSKEYINSYIKLDVECSHGHQYPVTFNNFQRGSRCPYCKKYRNEEECRNIFEKITTYKFLKKRPKWLRNPKTNYSLELDGYCEELKISFEYDGKQHFEKVKFFNKYKRSSLESIQERDQLKDKLCLENGVKLLRIKYDVEDKEELIQDFLNVSDYFP